MAKAEKKDILLFVHGSNWNRLGEKFRHKIWDQSDFKKQLGDSFVSLRVDYLESPDEKQKEVFTAQTKGLKVKFRSYPAIALYDPEGRHYATWAGSDFPLMASHASGLVLQKQQQRIKRDSLILLAKSQQGIKKAESLYLAVDTQTGLQKELIKKIKECDPNNESGYLSLLEFDGKRTMGQANKLAGEKKYEEALKWLDAELKKPKLNTEQKQWIMASKGNVYRRWENHLDEMNDAMMVAYKMDPQSVVGKACYRLARRFSGPPTLEFGWDSRHCDSGPVVWKVDASGQFDKPGSHQVTLQYRRGKSALDIRSVALWDGSTLVAQDTHDGSTGHQSTNNTYHFTIPKPLTKPILHIRCHTNASKNSQGAILVGPASS